MSICLCVYVVNMCLFGPPTLVGLGPIKSVLSVCPSVRDTLFSELTQGFSDLLHEVRGPEKLKSDGVQFLKKISFAQLGKRGPKIEFFVFFTKI